MPKDKVWIQAEYKPFTKNLQTPRQTAYSPVDDSHLY